jgi:hypothetical protein
MIDAALEKAFACTELRSKPSGSKTMPSPKLKPCRPKLHS